MFSSKEVTLQRTLLSKYGVRGVMYYQNKRIAHTLENPWIDNQRIISCIPTGKYKVKNDNTGRFKWWRIYDVPGRGLIEIHEGNNTISEHNNTLYIKNSLYTLRYLKKILPNNFTLNIEEQNSKIIF
jgi:hypothetical protein